MESYCLSFTIGGYPWRCIQSHLNQSVCADGGECRVGRIASGLNDLSERVKRAGSCELVLTALEPAIRVNGAVTAGLYWLHFPQRLETGV
jgi:hypothetical protein